jgi:predicted dehydrogenase
MGRNHLRVLSTLPQFELVGLFDANGEVAASQAKLYGIQAFDNYEALLNEVQAVHVATPSRLHEEYAVAAARAGRHVLVEKPLALTLAAADAIIAACEANKVTLCVGHIERYNPAITALANVVEPSDLISLDFQRLSPFDGRVQDADVVFDLMVHDLDILGWLVPAAIKRVQSQGVCCSSKRLDYAQALIEYESGIVASLTASRVTETKVRSARINGQGFCVVVDSLNRQVSVFRKTTYDLNAGSNIRYLQESVVQQVAVPFIEPLRAECEEFARAINEGDTPKTNAATARRAVELCELIVAGATIQPPE